MNREFISNNRKIILNDNHKATVYGNGCEVSVIEYSKNPMNNQELVTYQLKYWRGIHSEFMTHRVFSRNASSSRAIPISTFLKQVWNNPAGPIHWGANQPGMKAREELSPVKKWLAKKTWNITGKIVCSLVWLINKLVNPHKQTFNRLLEPWQYISVIMTTTELDNWFELRDHKDAQPEIAELAKCMKLAKKMSIAVKQDYHLPYITQEERENVDINELFKYSTARCARVSYLTHDGKMPSPEKDIKLHDQLVGSIPRHSSPSEHVALAESDNNFYANFRGWKQYRSLIEQQNTEVLK